MSPLEDKLLQLILKDKKIDWGFPRYGGLKSSYYVESDGIIVSIRTMNGEAVRKGPITVTVDGISIDVDSRYYYEFHKIIWDAHDKMVAHNAFAREEVLNSIIRNRYG